MMKWRRGSIIVGMKIAFDIGGVLSRYPMAFYDLMGILSRGGADVHIISDMPKAAALDALRLNGFHSIPPDKVHSADFAKYGDLCKTRLCESLGIDVLIDDRPDYCAAGSFIGMVLSPRPETAYFASDWKHHDRA